jgi:hypothetical protein
VAYPNAEDDVAGSERGDEQRQGRVPSDSEQLVGETAASEPLTATPGVQPPEVDDRTGNAGGTGRGTVPTDPASDREAELGHS